MTDDWDKLDDKLAQLEGMADTIEFDVAPQICEVMRAYAVKKITRQGAVDTGYLRNTVDTAEDIVVRNGETVVTMGIDCTAEYGLFIEYGTGPFGDPEIPHTTKEKWVYPTPDGEFRVGYPQHSRPFMRPALYDNVALYKDMIAGAITEVFD